MTLYTIDAKIEEIIEKGCTVDENGEYFDFDDLEQLEVDRDTKIDNTVWFLKNREYFLSNLETEKKKIEDRIKTCKNEINRTKSFLGRFLDLGKKLETATYKIGWRKSKSVEIINEDLIADLYKKEKTTISIDKKLVGEVLKSGASVPGAELLEKQNLQIK